MFAHRIDTIGNNPQWSQEAATWFAEKWGIPAEAYLESMNESAPMHTGDNQSANMHPVPQWFIVRDCNNPENPIIAGCGIIENDFHDRPDLSPNLCALFVEERFRNRGLATQLLDAARTYVGAHGIDSLYLITDHTNFYEKLGWEYLGYVNADDGTAMRMYRADASPKQPALN